MKVLKTKFLLQYGLNMKPFDLQKNMAELFNTTPQNITLNLKYKESNKNN